VTQRQKKVGRFGARDFNGIPRIVIHSKDYKNLPGNAVKLLMAIIHQYRGRNNGDLTAAYSVMKRWGFNSKQTLSNAINALLGAGLIVRTRTGRFMNPGGVCALYALAWQPVDECPGKRLEMEATNTPPRKFSLEQNK